LKKGDYLFIQDNQTNGLFKIKNKFCLLTSTPLDDSIPTSSLAGLFEIDASRLPKLPLSVITAKVPTSPTSTARHTLSDSGAENDMSRVVTFVLPFLEPADQRSLTVTSKSVRIEHEFAVTTIVTSQSTAINQLQPSVLPPTLESVNHIQILLSNLNSLSSIKNSSSPFTTIVKTVANRANHLAVPLVVKLFKLMEELDYQSQGQLWEISGAYNALAKIIVTGGGDEAVISSNAMCDLIDTSMRYSLQGSKDCGIAGGLAAMYEMYKRQQTKEGKD